MKYQAPISGNYEVCISFFQPTNEFEIVPNTNRKWWQFWKAKTIVRRKYKLVSNKTMVQAERGQSIINNWNPL